jgi:hypothetical protein
VRIESRTETKKLSVENSALGKTAGVINTVSPVAWVYKGINDVPVRYSETFTFISKGHGFKTIDTRVLEHDCHHYEINHVKKEPKEYKIEVKLFDWPDVWSTKATIEFAITEEV